MTRVYWLIAILFGALGSFDVARGEVGTGVAAFGVTVVLALAIVDRLVGDDR